VIVDRVCVVQTGIGGCPADWDGVHIVLSESGPDWWLARPTLPTAASVHPPSTCHTTTRNQPPTHTQLSTLDISPDGGWAGAAVGVVQHGRSPRNKWWILAWHVCLILHQKCENYRPDRPLERPWIEGCVGHHDWGCNEQRKSVLRSSRIEPRIGWSSVVADRPRSYPKQPGWLHREKRAKPTAERGFGFD